MKDKVSRKKPQYNIAFDERQVEYLNTIGKKKYFPLHTPDSVTLQEVVRTIVMNEMLTNTFKK